MYPLSIFFFLILIICYASLTFADTGLTTSGKAKLETLSQSGKKAAALALKTSSDPRLFVFTAQFFRMLIGVAFGVFFGDYVLPDLERFFLQMNIPLGFVSVPAGIIAAGTAVLVLFVFGFLLPKRIAMEFPEVAVTLFLPLVLPIIKISWPIVSMFDAATRYPLRFLGFRSELGKIPVTEEEIMTLIRHGTEAGTFDKVEQAMVERVFDLNDRRVNSLMTPRPDIVWLDLNTPAQSNRDTIIKCAHSYFPVAKGNLDNVLGVLHVKDLLARNLCGEPVDLTFSLKPCLFVPESTEAVRVLELFKQARVHVALIVDEYGTVQGLVTLTDILEAIVGDITVSTMNFPEQAVRREDGSWLVDGLIAVEDFRRIIEVDSIPGEDSGNFHTLAGFLMMHLGRIPKVSDHFLWNSWRFEVVDMEGNRVHKVLVSRQPEFSL